MYYEGGGGRAVKHDRRELKELHATTGLSDTISGGRGPGRSRGCPGLVPDKARALLACGPISWTRPREIWAGAVRTGACWAALSSWVAVLHGATRAVLVKAPRRGRPRDRAPPRRAPARPLLPG
ncbi:hypothetical protein NDU88_003205 [Pleurodeles waltl]|uniref:Uncharacterized protein n=1 Tax=Pleurodeles waltl TaxID=8319 RepID=A0AAV7P981_PLEWA|nr:hypothetical protein NDU88_003205 [Pleurodeles waltl]